jgi:hypothetical protein
MPAGVDKAQVGAAQQPGEFDRGDQERGVGHDAI